MNFSTRNTPYWGVKHSALFGYSIMGNSFGDNLTPNGTQQFLLFMYLCKLEIIDWESAAVDFKCFVDRGVSK
jgi:hypothetical protein